MIKQNRAGLSLSNEIEKYLAEKILIDQMEQELVDFKNVNINKQGFVLIEKCDELINKTIAIEGRKLDQETTWNIIENLLRKIPNVKVKLDDNSYFVFDSEFGQLKNYGYGIDEL